jgi:hypothetical protein
VDSRNEIKAEAATEDDADAFDKKDDEANDDYSC